jgi:peptidyl-tRNA hydrolase, PTH1 family
VVIHDEIDQSLGVNRLQWNRGHAGHNGIKSVHQELGTSEYFRLRMGVGRPIHPQMSVADWVLQDFAKDEEENLRDQLNESVNICEQLLKKGTI